MAQQLYQVIFTAIKEWPYPTTMLQRIMLRMRCCVGRMYVHL